MSGYTGTDNLEVMAEAINYNQYLLRLIARHARADDRILDFGAGIGTFARELHRQQFDVACVETDNDQARLIAAGGIPVTTSIQQVADDSIDYIYTLNVLEHIEHDRAAMAELCRTLRPGGTLFIYLPAFQLLYSSMDEKVGHYRRYSRGQLSALAAESGLQVSECRYADSLGFFATLLYKMIGSDDGSINKRSLILYDRIAFPLSRKLDVLFGRLFGKNVYLVARKAASAVGS